MINKKYSKSIFLFRRDLRLDDNIGLIAACNESKIVFPCFIFDVSQVTNKNKYKSEKALQFMIESLFDLQKQIQKNKGRLHIFYGRPELILKNLIQQEKIEAIFVNKDYTPFSKSRDQKIAQICSKLSVDFKQFPDLLLSNPDFIIKSNKKPYTLFTPFFKKARLVKPQFPQKLHASNFYTKHNAMALSIENVIDKIMPFNKGKTLNGSGIIGGRENGLKILHQINSFANYDKLKDFPALNATTKLSAHHKFGTISIRESYYAVSKALGSNHALIRQLYWRDFFTQIAYHFPHIFGHAFNAKYNKISWLNDKTKFNAWCQGKTGFPIIDAGMRQLNSTGFMHNRVRMITASFLVKDLHIDWRWGEQYFATKLVDYDPSVNNGNWQWVASTGADIQPYFRIFNPWLQQKKFDLQCEYIKEWIAEIRHLTSKQIHNLFKTKQQIQSYPTPIVDHNIESKIAILTYKKQKSPAC